MKARWLRRGGCVAAIALLAVVFVPSAAEACPMCKEALGSSEGGDLVSGFFYSILFMLSMPFVILGSLSSYLYLEVRRARARQAAVPSQSQPAAAAPGRESRMGVEV